MPYIRVRPEGLQRMSEMLDRVEKDIEQREEAFSIVSRNLDWQVKREEDIDWQLRCICIELQEEKQKIAEIAEYLRRASVIYEKLEKNLQDEDERSLSYGTVYNQNEQETPFGTAYVAVYSWLLEVSKNIMKAVSEKNKDEVTGLAGDLVSYCDSLIKFFTGDSKHAPFGIGQWCILSKASASVWKGFYTVFKKSFSDEKTQNLFEKKFGSWATAVGVAGGLMGILGAVTEYSRNGSSTANIGKETVGFGKTLYLIGKDPVFKYPAHVYTSILQSAMDVAGQTYDSIHKYKEDGHWSLEDTAYTGIEASVKGLDTLLSKISFGVFSLKTAGTSAGDTAKWLEEKTTEIGEAAGKLIASNPESKQAFQNGNVAKRLQMIVQAMWQKK